MTYSLLKWHNPFALGFCDMSPFAYLEPTDADEVGVKLQPLCGEDVLGCHAVQRQGVEIDASKCSASCSADDAWLGVRGRPGVLKGLMFNEILESTFVVFGNLFSFSVLFHLIHKMFFPCLQSQAARCFFLCQKVVLMVNCWFGARWFGFLAFFH